LNVVGKGWVSTQKDSRPRLAYLIYVAGSLANFGAVNAAYELLDFSQVTRAFVVQPSYSYKGPR
jgi:hypothetical protein